MPDIQSMLDQQHREEAQGFAREDLRFHSDAAIYEAQVGARAVLLLVAFLVVGVLLLHPTSRNEILGFAGLAAAIVALAIYVFVALRSDLSKARYISFDRLKEL